MTFVKILLHRIAVLAIYAGCLLCFFLVALTLPFYIIAGSPRSWRMIVAVDRLGNALFGGDDRETLSSRADRVRAQDGRRWACVLCRVLDAIQAGHCQKSAGK